MLAWLMSADNMQEAPGLRGGFSQLERCPGFVSRKPPGKETCFFQISVRWYKTCRKLRTSATLPLEASLSAVLSCFDPDWRYRLTAVEMSPSANLIWEEHVWQSFSCIWTKNTCFMFLPEISCQLEQVKFLEGKCLADCVRLLQLTLGATIFFIYNIWYIIF